MLYMAWRVLDRNYFHLFSGPILALNFVLTLSLHE